MIIVSGIYIISSYGFKTSIEYTGGTVFSYNSSKQEDLNSIKNFLKSVGYETSEVSQEGNFIKIKVSETNSDKVVDLKAKVSNFNNDLKIESSETIGSSMGIEFAKNSFLALLFSLLGILLFVTYSFYNAVRNNESISTP